MKEEYDFSNSIKNPYTKKLKKLTTIQLEDDVVDYFKSLEQETEIPYQSLIKLYLKDCVKSKRKIEFDWKETA